LGVVRLTQGDHERAAKELEDALALARRRGDRLGAYIALYNLALLAQARGDHDAAGGLLAEGVRLSVEVRDRANLAYCLAGLAAVAGARGGAERAARLFGAAEGVLETVGGPVYSFYQPDRSHHERLIAAARAALGEPAFAAAWAAGRALTVEGAVAYALGDAECRDGGA
jgi:tetratricopeptide (TPR) repeat protein